MSEHQQIKDLEERFARGEISRREFMIAISALGVTFALGISPTNSEAATATVAMSGTASGFSPYVEDVFSTYTYTGTGTTQTINNGIALVSSSGWWVASEQDGTYTYSNAVAADSSGNVYTHFLVELSSVMWACVAKYNSNGALQWSRRFTDTSADSNSGIAVDASGNVFVVNTLAGNTFTLVKYNSAGVLQWQRRLTSASSPTLKKLSVDSSGNVLGVGSNSSRLFMFKYNTSGTLLWQRTLNNSSDSTAGWSIASDSSDNVYVSGNWSTGGGDQLILVKYNSSGVIQWQRTAGNGGVQNCYGYGLAIDSSLNVHVSGFATQSAQLQMYVMKFNSSGTLQWTKTMQSGSNSQINSISVSSAGDLYCAGYVTGGSANFICKLNSSGAIQWQKQFTGSSVRSSAITSLGDFLIYGSPNTTINRLISLKQDNSVQYSSLGGIVLSSITVTEVVNTISTATSSFTDAAGSLTEAAGTATETASAAVITTSSQAAVTSQGGMVWVKNRGSALSHYLTDSARGTTQTLSSDTTAAQTTGAAEMSYQSTGFTLLQTGANSNGTSNTYASWTFRKAPKFFDVVTYTGDGALTKTINHNLGVRPGMIIIKRRDSTGAWGVWHRAFDNPGDDRTIWLNETIAANTNLSSGFFRYTGQTSLVNSFQVYMNSPSAGYESNANGAQYVAYLFAHDTSATGIIQCGTFTEPASGYADLNLGWEPQFLLTKATNATSQWEVLDNSRGFNYLTADTLRPNQNQAECVNAGDYMVPTATGVRFKAGFLGSAAPFLYLAIRRGPMRVPTSGTSVYYNFSLPTGTVSSPNFDYGDMGIAMRNRFTAGASAGYFYDRLRGVGQSGTGSSLQLNSASTAAETSVSANQAAGLNTTTNGYLYNNALGLSLGMNTSSTDGSVAHIFRRAPSFFDVVCYSGTGSSTTQTHNLSVVPEFILIKRRDTAGYHGCVWHATYQDGNSLILNGTNLAALNTHFPSGNHSSSTFNLTNNPNVNASGGTYVAYLFASCPGVSKIGTYTGNGSATGPTTTVGFQPRWLLVKRSDSTGNWCVWDSARSTSNPRQNVLFLNSTAVETTSGYDVDFNASNFQIKSTSTDVNANSGTYLYMAIS